MSRQLTPSGVMAPKPKKTKEEKAAEKAKKEEEARLAEEGESVQHRT